MKSSNGFVNLPLSDLKTLTQAADVGEKLAVQNNQLKSLVAQKDNVIITQHQQIETLQLRVKKAESTRMYLYIIIFVFLAFITIMISRKK